MGWKFWRSTDPIYMDHNQTQTKSRSWLRIVLGLVLAYVVVCLALGVWWSMEPSQFSVRQNAAGVAEDSGQSMVTGYVTTATVIELADTLLEKPGGYLSNDVFPPGIWLDNLPQWEFGVLILLRDTARIYRNDFSRSQSQSAEDPDLNLAESNFYYDHSSWWFPQSEDEYREGRKRFGTYLGRLADPSQADAQFYARADNLVEWLAAVETRLGSLSQRLSASVGKRQLNIDLAGDAAASQATAAPADQIVKTPWLEIDDVFYETRGFTWALLHMLRAIEQDFGDVLDKKNARVSLQQIIRELEPSQDTVFSPLILNGDGMGMLANHSLVMGSYVSRANAAIIDLRRLLTQG